MTAVNLRPELAQQLRQRLEAFGEGFRHNVAIVGPPGSGKTFQLQQLLIDPPQSLTLVYCPLYRESCRSFLQRLLCAILQSGMPAAVSGADGDAAMGSERRPLETLLRLAEVHLPKTASAIGAIEPLLERRLYGEAFNRTLDTIPILIEERQKPCVLILDEFLFLEELGLIHAFHELGKRVMTWHSTLFILSSSSPYRARIILRERLQLLFGQFELLSLDTIDPHPVAQWVQGLLSGVQGVEAMSPFLIRWLGAYPWYLNVFLKRFTEVALLKGSLAPTEGLFLQTAWDVLGSGGGTLHQWCVSRMESLGQGRLGAKAIEALIQIAEGTRTITDLGKRIGRAGLSEALQLLLEHDLAQRNGTCWLVPDPVLRCWLSTVLLAQRSDASLSDEDLRQRVERNLRSLWSRWVESAQRSFAERVVDLFGRFHDDTVSLDSKVGRLPKFEAITKRPSDIPGTDAYLIADGQGKRWCATVQTGPIDEQAIASFENFCRAQTPKPSRKVIILKSGMDPHARLLAKAINMWVWEPDELQTLMDLFGQL